MSFSVCTLNVNGMRATVRHGFRNWRARTKVDVWLLQELRMQPDQMEAVHKAPRGWQSAQMDAEKRGYSGVAAWTRLDVTGSGTGCGLDWADKEGRVAWLDTAEGRMVSVYLPSGSSGEARQGMKEAFMDHFFDWSQAQLDRGGPVLMGGDLNIAHTAMDIHNPTGNKKNSGFLPSERAWFSTLLEQGWVDLYRHLNPEGEAYSWWSNRGQARKLDRGWRIDYLLASPELAARAEACWMVGRVPALSDHCGVMASFR